MRVAVAGAGIGGLCLALALRARGVEAVVCERAGALGEAGAGVQLGPNAVKVMDRLGVGEALRSAASRPEAIEVRSAASGRRLQRTPLGGAAVSRWGAPYLQLHRSDLQALLLQAVRERGAADLRLGAEAVGVDEDGLVLADGSPVHADAVVGADGLRSAVAGSLFGPEAPRFTGWTAWRAVVARSRVAAEVPPATTVWTAPEAHVVHYPLRGGSEINLVAVTAARDPPDEDWRKRADVVELSRAFRDWPSPVRELAAAAQDAWGWALFDRPPRPRWSRGAATLLGDAAHPMTPFLAQGAAMAIEDAWVLADALGAGGDPPEALRSYEALRRPRTARVQAWSRQNARLFHLPDTLAAAAFAAGGITGAARGRMDRLYGWSPS